MVVYRGEATSDDPMPLNSAGSYDFPIKYGYQVVGRVSSSRVGRFPAGTRVFVRHPHQTPVHRHGGGVRADRDPRRGGRRGRRVPQPGSRRAQRARRRGDRRGRDGGRPRPGDRGLARRADAAAHRRAADRGGPGRVAARARAAVGRGRRGRPRGRGRAIEAATHGRGADVSIEASGAGPALQAAIDTTGEEGRIIVVSYYGRTPVPSAARPGVPLAAAADHQLPRDGVRARHGRSGTSTAGTRRCSGCCRRWGPRT